MSPDFARAVDNIFIYVLGLLERIERGETPIPSDERTHIRNRVEQAEAMLGPRDDWALSKYALVAWIDDMLIEAPWDGCDEWAQNPLEVEYFNAREAFTRFYERGDEAGKLARRDALEVYYVCVVLGFRGMYRDPSGAVLAEQMGLPPDIESWARKAAMAIQLGQGRPPIADHGSPGAGAPPLEGKFHLVGAILFAVIMAAVTTITVGYLSLSMLNE